MKTSCIKATLKAFALTTTAYLGMTCVGVAQEVALASLTPAGEGSVVNRPTSFEPAPLASTKSFETTAPREAAVQHRFWDRQNSLLFAASAAFSAADFVVTRDNLRGGGQELNPVTSVFSGSTAGLAVNFAGETAGVVGLSYVFHKTGHHKLERLVSMVNIGSSAAAVGYDLAHR